MEPQRVTGELWLWRAPHPEWQPGSPGSPEDWPREVGCVLYETPDSALFIDPQLPTDRKAFWAWSDARCAGRDVTVLTTTELHARSREMFARRYGAACCAADSEPLLPAGVECFRIRATGEALVWLSGSGALVAGDAIVGGGDGKLRLCPESWLDHTVDAITAAELQLILRELLDGLPVECVLVSHGEPVLSDGRAALDRALAPNRLAVRA
ncbi:MAG: hypothetical protein ABSC56_07445 [Solirubrobacteraceae bacterium]|jgi:glyoxylase-like metal-dependent hydrolase (beta-lactamase superfamily II)